jgi:hypothetical protein
MPAAVNQVQFATQVAIRVRNLSKQIEDSVNELNILEAKRQNGDFDFANIDFNTAPGLGFVDDTKLRAALSAAQSIYSGGDFVQVRSVSTAG